MDEKKAVRFLDLYRLRGVGQRMRYSWLVRLGLDC